MPGGAFIVFEGADRSGKTTQTQRCVSALIASGVSVTEGSPWRFPDRTTKIGKMINSYLADGAHIDDEVLHLLFSANRWEKSQQIRQALARGETVVVDRYAYSGVAYSAAKGLDMDWCRTPDVGLPAPDVVIYLDLSFEAASKRGEFGAERYENEKMQRAVAACFVKMRTASWKIIDADADEETVFSRVMDAVTPAISGVRESNEVSKLWED